MKKMIGVIILMVTLANAKESDVAVISTTLGDMVIEFFPDVAPKHVESFTALANETYFDGTTFHRVIPGFVIQGGDPNSKNEDRTNHGQGGRAGKFFGIGKEDDSTTWLLPEEFNARPHNRGALSMARTNDPNSASSQFFICVDNVNQLDNKYTVFGRVIQGMEVADKIVSAERDRMDNPLDRIEMQIRIVPRSTVIKE